MKFGFVLIEGYCSFEFDNEAIDVEILPCKSTGIGIVSHHCLIHGDHCKYFGFCKCSDMCVETDQEGFVVKSDSAKI